MRLCHDSTGVNLMKKMLAIAAVGISFGLPFWAGAVPVDCPDSFCFVSDDNSTVGIDPEETPNPGAMTEWTVDGVNHLFEQGWWVRHDLTSDNLHQSDLDLLSATEDDDTNVIELLYTDGIIEVRSTYSLFGGAGGSGLSDISETHVITNLTSSTNAQDLDLTFFVYTDPDINESTDGETAEFINGDTIVQTDSDGVSEMVVTATTPITHFEIDFYSSLLDDLELDPTKVLDDSTTPLGPDDITHAFQWDFFTLDVGASATVVVQKQVNAVLTAPEPGTLALLGMGLIGLSFRVVRRS